VAGKEAGLVTSFHKTADDYFYRFIVYPIFQHGASFDIYHNYVDYKIITEVVNFFLILH
jgi:hypothetical protein